MTLEALIGRTVLSVERSDYGDELTLILDNDVHVRLGTGEWDDGPIHAEFLDRRMRVAEIIDRRVREFEQRQAESRRAVRAEEQRIIRERMERLLRPAAYREWLRRHQPRYMLNRALKEAWAGDRLQTQLYSTSPFIVGEQAVIPIVGGSA